MSRVLTGMILATATSALIAGCGERPQNLVATSAKPDGKPWQGAQDRFAAKGWDKGDKEQWELQLRRRAQTQNEYEKTR